MTSHTGSPPSHSRINSAVIFFNRLRAQWEKSRRAHKQGWTFASRQTAGKLLSFFVCRRCVHFNVKHQRNLLCCLLWKFVITFLYARNKSTPGRISCRVKLIGALRKVPSRYKSLSSCTLAGRRYIDFFNAFSQRLVINFGRVTYQDSFQLHPAEKFHMKLTRRIKSR